MKQFLTLSGAASIAFAAQLAVAQGKTDTPPSAGSSAQANVAMCIGCHGIPGYKTAFPEVYHVPKIAGQQPAYLEAALKAYRAGQRPHPSMRGIAGSLTDEQIAAYARYYGGDGK